MKYKALKDIATITMGQSPNSSSYNEEKNGMPFYQGNADFGNYIQQQEFGAAIQKK